MIVLGLTGSIGMGKTTTAGLFAKAGIPVHDSDQVVHALYAGKAVPAIERQFPGSTCEGQVDREKLSEALKLNPAKFGDLEAIVHPLVRAEEKRFLDVQKAAGQSIVVLDIPLLFETGGNRRVDKIAVVTCDADIQKKRVMNRPGMTEEKFALILSRQMPDSEKRARADFIIDTGHGLEAAEQTVSEILTALRPANGLEN
jgi:dephospho-CoA kinase